MVRSRNRADDECKDERGDVNRFRIRVRVHDAREDAVRRPCDDEQKERGENDGNRIVGEYAERAKDRRDREQDHQIVHHEAVHRDVVQKSVNEIHGCNVDAPRYCAKVYFSNPVVMVAILKASSNTSITLNH